MPPRRLPWFSRTCHFTRQVLSADAANIVKRGFTLMANLVRPNMGRFDRPCRGSEKRPKMRVSALVTIVTAPRYSSHFNNITRVGPTPW